jgi:hypothetical protein
VYMKRVIAVECWADEYFFGRLLMDKALIRKEKNKAEVFKSIKERSKGNFSIGIVDKDNEEAAAFLKGFEIQKKVNIGAEIEVVKIADKPWFVLQLAPVEFERWIEKFLDLPGCKKLAEFGYENIRNFCNDSKVIAEKLIQNEKIMNVLNYVLSEYDKTDNHIKKAKKILDYLVAQNYRADINEIANG